MPFVLDDRLKRDTLLIHETGAILCLLVNDQRYPWVILVPKLSEISEVYELPEPERNQLQQASLLLGQELMGLFAGSKLNVGTLGNIVRQLHIHHVVRFEDDDAWPGPVWGFGKAIPYPEEERSKMLSTLRSSLTFCQ